MTDKSQMTMSQTVFDVGWSRDLFRPRDYDLGVVFRFPGKTFRCEAEFKRGDKFAYQHALQRIIGDGQGDEVGGYALIDMDGRRDLGDRFALRDGVDIALDAGFTGAAEG